MLNKSSVKGGSILVLGRRRLYPVRPVEELVGKVSAASCGAALDALQDAIAQELLEQGKVPGFGKSTNVTTLKNVTNLKNKFLFYVTNSNVP